MYLERGRGELQIPLDTGAVARIVGEAEQGEQLFLRRAGTGPLDGKCVAEGLRRDLFFNAGGGAHTLVVVGQTIWVKWATSVHSPVRLMFGKTPARKCLASSSMTPTIVS